MKSGQNLLTLFFAGMNIIPCLLQRRDQGGTGLGLSLSYDIIKAHGGELKVETKEGEGAEFVIQLPAMGYGIKS
jgi:K+-sensing histidine kinase KdpD